jgi:hypothetical protein
MGLQEVWWGHGLNRSGSEQGKRQVAGCYKRGIEASGFILWGIS